MIGSPQFRSFCRRVGTFNQKTAFAQEFSSDTRETITHIDFSVFGFFVWTVRIPAVPTVFLRPAA